MLFISSIFTAIAVILLVCLSVNVVRMRYRYVAALGDKKQPELQLAIRAQNNFVEYIAVFLIALALSEMAAAPHWWLWLTGSMFFIGRVSHAYSLLKAEVYDEKGQLTAFPYFRTAGMTLTFLSLVMTACMLLVAAMKVT